MCRGCKRWPHVVYTNFVLQSITSNGFGFRENICEFRGVCIARHVFHKAVKHLRFNLTKAASIVRRSGGSFAMSSWQR